MARYTEAVCRLCRREGLKLYLKGERCYTEKCGISRRAFVPGQHGQGRRNKPSEYGLQLREKQKARRIYGVLESQFRRYFKEADRRKGVTGENLLRLLELRMDNVVYRLGLAASRAEARQLVRHGHFNVNGRKVSIPSYQVSPGEVITVRPGSSDKGRFKDLAELLRNQGTVEWLEVDRQALSGRVVRLPAREEIDVPITEHLIVELYSR
ncbi:MAG: 30S ribosomal protein S4 [Syntrophomonadaceae bacterium]|nr:30S ribosomal protein S4 [Bacillota bacterium]